MSNGSAFATEREQRGIASHGGRVRRDGLLDGETRQIVWAAGLRARARQAHTAERLHADDRADHVAIHIDVTRPRAVRDAPCKSVYAGMDAERETEAGGVDL